MSACPFRNLVFCTTLALAATACAGREVSMGFRFAEDACTLRPGAMDRFGDVLTADERRSIQDTARAEVERAFAAFRVQVSDSADAFWRIGGRAVASGAQYEGAAQGGRVGRPRHARRRRQTCRVRHRGA